MQTLATAQILPNAGIAARFVSVVGQSQVQFLRFAKHNALLIINALQK
jgi:hypothetical protein